MALKKNNNTESNVNAATSASTPAFEGETQMENTVNTHAAVETNDAPQNTVAVRQNTAVGNVEDAATKAKNFQKEVEAMKGALNLDYGSVQMFKANQGKIGETDGDKRKLGRYAQVRLLAWDDRYELSTGDSGKSSKDFLAFSKDGVTVDNVVGDELKKWEGKPVADYLDYLRTEEEFDKASKRQFIDCGVAVLESETGEAVGEIVNISLSPSSVRAFEKYQNDLLGKARAASLGLPGFKLPEDPFTFWFVCEDAEKGDNQWTKLKITDKKPTKL